MISHRFALEKASQASVDGNYMEGICFSLLAIALSDGLRHNPELHPHSHSHDDALGGLSTIAELASSFFRQPDDKTFALLQQKLTEWENLRNG
jgi:hypothetical protein